MRIFYLDAARSVLMSLGVVLHTAAMYDPLLKWALTDPKGNVVFHMLRVAIHVFRMPAFFMLSGFFCLMVMGKYGDRFLRVRLTRILVPLLATALIVNTVQAYVLYDYRDSTLSFFGYYAGSGVVDLLRSGRWVSHLWFLINLALYTVVAYAAWRALQQRSQALEAALDTLAPVLERPAGLFLLPALGLLPWAAAYKLHGLVQPVLGFLDLADLVHYGLFFALGMWMFHRRQMLERFSRAGWATVLAAGLSIAGLVALELLPVGAFSTLVEYYCDTLLALSVSVMVLHLFRRFASGPSKVFSYLSEASYTVYLFHHLTVLVLGILLMDAPLNAYVKFPIVVVSTFAIVLAIHHFLVLKIKPLRFLFNGKYGDEARVAPAAAAGATRA
ncbi:MAG: acyltransferase family protein [Pseudomonadota bacterium]